MLSTYHKSMRLSNFLSSVVDNGMVSTSLIGWLFSSSWASPAVLGAVVVFMGVAIFGGVW